MTEANGSTDAKCGLKIDPLLVKSGECPYETIEWERRRAEILDGEGNVIFEQDDIEVPSGWSMLAANIVSSKYFYGEKKTDEREYSVRQLVHRVARTVTDWGTKDGFFASPLDADNYYKELSSICLNQHGSFNSPVWFNVGLGSTYGHTSNSGGSYEWNADKKKSVPAADVYKRPQVSACFIQSVDDTMEDIMRLATAEAVLFKHGSGSGTDLSTIRSSREKLSGGGKPSGPLSFMRVFDQVAAVVKSGGKTRRAAKMQSLKVGHPDIMEFIDAKGNEERKALALVKQGYDGSFNGEAYDSVMYQNANLSVRVTDEFMMAAEDGGDWDTKAVTTGETVETLNATDVLRAIATGASGCGDPGVQYDTTINKWHTCPNSGPINASNPCSEYMFLDDSACNLASINLMKMVDENGVFDIEKFKHVVRIFIIAQEILVDNASYPTEDIATNSHLYRPLGLGYANLGALLMKMGLPYDSDAGRNLAGSITALMTGKAYETSQELASEFGSFEGFKANREPMMRVMAMHADAATEIDEGALSNPIRDEAVSIWRSVSDTGWTTGIRNSQVTVLAPTGTIGFMMDCDTTGVEPDIALVKSKQLAGGGVMKIVNNTVPAALKMLGYSGKAMEEIVKYVDEAETIEGAPGLQDAHLPVFDCAFCPKDGVRFIRYTAHIMMMSAVQPFLSGAISKTVNVPFDATVEEIQKVYIGGWKLGLKAVAIYRDGSKGIQPLSAGGKHESKSVEKENVPARRRMETTRPALIHKFEVSGHEGYLTVGMYGDGAPGELFITMSKEGSTIGGMMNSFGITVSLCLQYGVPLDVLCNKFSYTRFEPSGFTKNSEIPIAKSIVDYIFRWFSLTFPDGTHGGEVKVSRVEERADASPDATNALTLDAPACTGCGGITVRSGTCYVCSNCGTSAGCS